MKITLYTFLFLSSLIFFSSCDKQYDCVCSYDYDETVRSEEDIERVFPQNGSKEDAEDACALIEYHSRRTADGELDSTIVVSCEVTR